MKLPCENYRGVYDALTEGHVRGEQGQVIIETARNLCGSCAIKTDCHADNKNEQWLRVMKKGSKLARPTSAERAAALKAERISLMRTAVLNRTPIDVAVRQAGVSRDTLVDWANDHGVRHLYDAIVRGTE